MAQFNFPPDMIGYSLVRFSTKKQADGDSYRRQLAAAEDFSRDEGIPLDMSLHEADIRKLGISAFSEAHVVKGPLRKFIAGMESGTVKPGKSLLLVSEWNRLTRQVASDALKLTIWLMESGIGIVDLQDRNYYTLERYNADTGMQIMLQAKISMAHQYSQNLRHNLKAKWVARRQAIEAGKGKPTNASPEWLTVRDDGTWNAIERPREPTPDDPRTTELWAVPVDDRTRDVFRAIERVKADRALGLGKNAIATRLNSIDPLPAFRTDRGWYGSSVEKLVKNEALRGIYQPRNIKDEPMGDPRSGFYPRVMSDADWYRMQWPVNVRAARGRRTGGVLNNLFAELLHCRCGGGLVRENKGKNSGGAYLVCSRARRGLCDDRTRYPLGVLEAELLDALTLFDVETLVQRLTEMGNPHADAIAALEAEIATKNALIEEIASGFGGNAPPAFYKRMQAMQTEVDAATAALASARREAKISQSRRVDDAHAAFRQMVRGMTDLEGEELYQLRLKLARELKRLIEGGDAERGELLIRFRVGLSGLPGVLVVNDCRVNSLRIMDPNGTILTQYERAAFSLIDPIVVPEDTPERRWEILGGGFVESGSMRAA